MKEIGGYFELEKASGKGFYPDLIPLNSGRSALLCLIKARNITKLYIPYYLCDAVSGICRKCGCDFEYYSVGPDFLPTDNIRLNSGEYMYIVNYFGQLDQSAVVSLKNKYGSIILDNVLAFFCPPIAGIDTIYSCRKFFGVPDGAYLSTDAEIDEGMPISTSFDRMTHLLGRFEMTASEFYDSFKENEELFETDGVMRMSRISENILAYVDYKDVSKVRRRNFDVLHSLLGSINSLSPANNEGPYAYPFMCKNGVTVKKALAEKEIYIATLWPEVLNFPSITEYTMAENILPLPCDQRYGTDDMEYIAKEVLACLKSSD